jgi:N-acetylneuraminic acid mutarotase
MRTADLTLAVAVVLTGCGGGGEGDDGGDADGWEARAPLPEARQETAVVAIGETIYVIGGMDANGEARAEVFAYDVATDAWSADVPALPAPVHHANAAVVDGTIYVLGAFTPADVRWRWTPGDEAWATVAARPGQPPIGSAAVAVIGGRIVLAGGKLAQVSRDTVSIYDPEADAWTTGLAPLPRARDHAAFASDGEALYVIGGRDLGDDYMTDRVDRYDPAADEWTERAPMPTVRGGVAAGVVDGAFVVVGGEQNADEPSGVFAEVEVYDHEADAWTSLPPMADPRHGMGVVGVGGWLYVPGGGEVEGVGAVDRIDRLRI